MAQLIEALAAAQWPEEMAIYLQAIALLWIEMQEVRRLDCAWCMVEAGIPLGNGSHGICQRHADAMLLERRARRLASVASCGMAAEVYDG